VTKEEIEELVIKAAKEAAKEAQKDLFLLMGVKLEDSNDIVNMQKNFQHLQESREGKEEFMKKGKSALMAVFITGTLALLVKGFWAQLVSFISGGG
jgi:DNA-binding protein YbaB